MCVCVCVCVCIIGLITKTKGKFTVAWILGLVPKNILCNI